MNLKSLVYSKKLAWLVFFIVLAISLYLKVLPVLNYNFPFTMDQARDMLDIRHIIELRNPTLIGPTTSINGVFLGPFYYYFNLLPYIVSGGDPAALTYWNILWYAIGAGLLFWFFYKKDIVFALVGSVIYMMAPAFFYSSRFFWNANPMPYMTVFYILSLFSFFRKQSYLGAAILGLIAGLSMQVEAAFGVIFLPFFLVFGIIYRAKLKFLAVGLATFGLTLVPQILFELRNNFVMSKTFLSEISGASQILGEKLPIGKVFENHLNTYIDFCNQILELPYNLSSILVGVSFGYLLYLAIKKILDKEYRLLFMICSGFILFSFSFYMLYHYPIKGWYLLGLRVPYIILIALFLTNIFNIKKYGYIFKSGIIVLLALSFFLTYTDQSRFILKDQERSGDKSTLRNELEAIDWVYQKAGGQGFKAFNYIPSVYDYPYQYLYWWHGTNKYGYQPETLSYLEGVPEYIDDNDQFYNLKKPAGEDPLIFLIYEKDENLDRRAAWLGNFTKFCTVEKVDYSWETTVEMRKACK